jgi:flagellar export protein FliJ
MKIFHFPLQAVQTLRQRQEQLALKQYAAAIRRRRLAGEQLAAVEEELETVWHSISGEMSSPVCASEIVRLQQYCRSVQDRRQHCLVELHAAEETVGQTWQALIGARQRREMIDQYHLTLQRRYQREFARREQVLSDELANRRSRSSFNWKANPEHSNN